MEIRNKYHKTIGFFLMAFALTIIATFSYATTNMDVTVKEIYFNYEDGNTNDALTISNDGDSIINHAEWDSNYGETHKFAYIKEQSNRKIKVRFNAGSYSGVMHLLIKISYDYYDDGIGTICNLFIPNFDISTNDSQILTLNGALPNSVGVHRFDWEWEIYAIPVNNSNYCAAWSSTFTTHHFFTVLAAPQAPMEQPWERVLDYACDWASGQASEYYIISQITEKAYENIGKQYSGAGTHAVVPNFNLTAFFSDNWADCRDMSAIVQVFSNALGVQNIQVRRINGQFVYKPILPVGIISWKYGKWNFHQIGYYNNVFDACLKLNLDSPRIPIDEPINGIYKTDLFDSGSWTPINATRYTYVN